MSRETSLPVNKAKKDENREAIERLNFFDSVRTLNQLLIDRESFDDIAFNPLTTKITTHRLLRLLHAMYNENPVRFGELIERVLSREVRNTNDDNGETSGTQQQDPTGPASQSTENASEQKADS
jgi:hypothetical protein